MNIVVYMMLVAEEFVFWNNSMDAYHAGNQSILLRLPAHEGVQKERKSE